MAWTLGSCSKDYFEASMLNENKERAFDAVDFTGLAVRRTGNDQWHVALLYKVDRKPAALRHQCEHNGALDAAPDSFFDLWLDIAALSSLNKRLIANKLSKARGDKIPYGIGYSEGADYLDGKTLKYLLPHAEGRGLTCATYVLAVFETLGFQPFDRSTWQPREQDSEWQSRTVGSLSNKHPSDDDHFKAERANVGGPRYRPEQLAGAAAARQWPISQERSDELATAITAEYNQKRPLGARSNSVPPSIDGAVPSE